MQSRERILTTLSFGQPDRVPLQPGNARKSTLKNWHATGLDPAVRDYNLEAYCRVGGQLPWPEPDPDVKSFYAKERMMPEFEEAVLEEKPNSRVVRDWKGNICEIGREFDPAYLRNAVDFVTRRWIKCPVENRADWADMQKRYDASVPQRLPPDAADLGLRLKDRSGFMELHFSGPFWQLREWVGFENLCTMFYDDPVLVREMVVFWENYIAALLERVLEVVVPDCVHFSEDMAYKGFSMISPAMTREFLLPTWKRWGEIIRGAGVPLYAMDSDGFIGELIPLWIEAGINVCDPIEVAAGNDLNEFRKNFGSNMAYRGGVDKRAMAKGGRVIEGEIARLQSVIDAGGYIPSCDHGVPADIAWPDYVHYVRTLARATGWLP